MQKGEQSRTAVPDGPIPPLGHPLDKIGSQIAHSSQDSSHTICHPISLYVSVPVGACPPAQTFLWFTDRQNRAYPKGYARFLCNQLAARSTSSMPRGPQPKSATA